MTCPHCEQAEMERQDDSLHCYKCGCVVYPQNNTMSVEMEIQKQIIQERGLGKIFGTCLSDMTPDEVREHNNGLKRNWAANNKHKVLTK